MRWAMLLSLWLWLVLLALLSGCVPPPLFGCVCILFDGGACAVCIEPAKAERKR